MRCVGISVNCTVTGHVSCTTTDPTDDVRGEVALLWTIVFAMTDSATILADLVLVVTECTIERSKFAQLITLVVVLAFGCGSSLVAS